MPIGTQTIGDRTITEMELRKKYDYIIKNAIQQADSSLEVIRADEELNPGSISNDIFTKLMHSKYVIADVTYPNPNVFYELGIRHAISPRTILIREKDAPSIPFDISHLRYIEYTQEADGMDNLKRQLISRFEFYRKNPDKPDNQFLELCAFTNYTPTLFCQKVDPKKENLKKLFEIFFSRPELLSKLMKNGSTPESQQQAVLEEISKDPELMLSILKTMIDSEQ